MKKPIQHGLSLIPARNIRRENTARPIGFVIDYLSNFIRSRVPGSNPEIEFQPANDLTYGGFNVSYDRPDNSVDTIAADWKLRFPEIVMQDVGDPRSPRAKLWVKGNPEHLADKIHAKENPAGLEIAEVSLLR
jgi:hypothetical protein